MRPGIHVVPKVYPAVDGPVWPPVEEVRYRGGRYVGREVVGSEEDDPVVPELGRTQEAGRRQQRSICLGGCPEYDGVAT